MSTYGKIIRNLLGSMCYTSRRLLVPPFIRFQSSKSCFYEAKKNVPPRFKQYKTQGNASKPQGNASNLVQFHFGSPASKVLESGIAPLVPRGFDPACWGLNQLPPSRNTTTLCNALQYTATHCSTLQHTTKRCNTHTNRSLRVAIFLSLSLSANRWVFAFMYECMHVRTFPRAVYVYS